MKQIATHTLPLIQCAAYWRAIAAMLIAVARHAARVEGCHPRSGWACANYLEVAARTALTCIVSDIHRVCRDHPPQTEEEARAYAQLLRIARAMIILAYVAGYLRTCLAGRRGSGFAPQDRMPGAPVLGRQISMCARTAQMLAPGFLDSS